MDFLKPVESLKALDAPVKPVVAPVEEKKPTVAAGIKEDEADEPLLQENPHRFVLFPIKYHEVSRQHITRESEPRHDALWCLSA